MAVTVLANFDSQAEEWSPVSIDTNTVNPIPLQDDARLLQALDALPAGALRETHPMRDLRQRKARILLEERHDLLVDGIHVHQSVNAVRPV
jgi:hypothetical protein